MNLTTFVVSLLFVMENQRFALSEDNMAFLQLSFSATFEFTIPVLPASVRKDTLPLCCFHVHVDLLWVGPLDRGLISF